MGLLDKVKKQQTETGAAAVVTAAGTAGLSPVQRMMQQIKETNVSQRREPIPLGTGIYVVNNIVYKETTRTPVYELDVVHVTGVKPITDAGNLRPGDPGYTGMQPGHQAEYSIFRNGKNAKPMIDYFQLLKCFGGSEFTAERIKELQATEDGMAQLLRAIEVIIGWDFSTNKPTSCGIANMVLCEIKSIMKISDKKINGEPVYDAQGNKVQVEFQNVYFNRQVPIAEVAPDFEGREEVLAGYFGGMENLERALELEQS